MPLTGKGDKIMKAMKQTYGSDEKAKEVFYASKNAGKISGVESLRRFSENLKKRTRRNKR